MAAMAVWRIVSNVPKLSNQAAAASSSSDDSVWGWQGKPQKLSKRARHIFTEGLLSDVAFRFQQNDGTSVDIKAHKLILAMGSAVFETMFYGSIPQTGDVIPIVDVDVESFRTMLRFIYEDEVGPFFPTTAFSTLYAADKYGMPVLKEAVLKYLREKYTPDNLLLWFVQARQYNQQELVEFFLAKIDSHGSDVLASDYFLEIDIDLFKLVLSRDTLKAKEVEVYHAAARWACSRCKEMELEETGKNQRLILADALYLVRFAFMTMKDITEGPVKSGLLPPEDVGRLFHFWFAKGNLPAHLECQRRLFCQQLDMYVQGLDSAREIKVLWQPNYHEEGQEFSVLINQQGTVGDLLEQMPKFVQLHPDGSGQLRLVEIKNCRVVTTHGAAHRLRKLSAADRVLRVEEIPLDQVALQESEQLIPVNHFQENSTWYVNAIYPASPVAECCGIPFYVKIQEGENFSSAKMRIQELLKAPQSQFKTYNFYLFRDGKKSTLTDESTINPKDLNGTAWFGIGHSRRTAKRPFPSEPDGVPFELPVPQSRRVFHRVPAGPRNSGE